VSYSTNSGTTWTHAALTFPAAATGSPCVTWDASRSLFVLSVILSTGEVAWSTSPTGATWQAFRHTAALAIPVASIAGSESAGIAVLGSTWVVPYATDPLAVGNFVMGIMMSIDGGASWRTITGKEKLNNCIRARCLAIGNRYAIVSEAGAIFGGDVVCSDLANSVSA
jgi:hypothetical protein